ncbi:MAG: transcriptional repressor [Crocinitomicaceae bacterium]|nr:transcriptional repressor [Crocinitomicaceae bacterium]
MENLLRKKGLRVTPFRVSVLEVFSRFKNAIDTAQIENELDNFDRITLYRTLKTFIESGLIHEIVMPGDIKKLALCKEECHHHEHEHNHQHLHFRCNECDEVFCLELKEFPSVKFPKFKIDRLEIQGTGVCGNCR